MPLLLLALALGLSFATLDFAQAMSSVRHAQVAARWNAELTSALEHSVTDAENALAAAARSSSGQISALPTDVSTSGSVCGASDSTDASETDCANTIAETVHFTGRSGAGGSGTDEALGNVNDGSGVNGRPFESVISFESTVALLSPDGTTTIAKRIADGTLSVFAGCDSAAFCHAGTPDDQIQFDGWQDQRGNSQALPVAQADGRCATSDPTCSPVGLDDADANGVQAQDSRGHVVDYCYDPNYTGNGGANPDDDCDPIGNIPAGTTSGDDFQNPTLVDGDAGNGAYSR